LVTAVVLGKLLTLTDPVEPIDTDPEMIHGLVACVTGVVLAVPAFATTLTRTALFALSPGSVV
jgi:hypothetical protein